ncbi:MAG TPA: helix-turn-helix domain-containing protein, partial [Rubrivivax sp.]|nr:helix-turn-helix domain-containing protein [Rubrivivax sp.]
GRLAEAAEGLDALDAGPGAPPALTAMVELTRAELALRSWHTAPARAALVRAQAAARRAGIPVLAAEVAEALAGLDRPAARRLSGTDEQPLRLDEVLALLTSDALVVDGCRRGLQVASVWRPLARRPILFALASALAIAWPGDLDRETLIQKVFRTRRADETHRARLRVQIGRLRALMAPLARIEATARGFTIRPHEARRVIVLAPPIEGEQAALLALLSDGSAWSTSALALALGDSQRTVQRALLDLEEAGHVRAIGQTRARRWLAAPLAEFTTILLLRAALPNA